VYKVTYIDFFAPQAILEIKFVFHIYFYLECYLSPHAEKSFSFPIAKIIKKDIRSIIIRTIFFEINIFL
jgi:hypothetical protein